MKLFDARKKNQKEGKMGDLIFLNANDAIAYLESIINSTPYDWEKEEDFNES